MTDVKPAATAGDDRAFREAMRTLAGGVVILTTWIEERPWGMTISACCSVSAEPPRVLVSVGHLTCVHAAIKAGNRFGVNVLGSDQKHIAEFGATPGQAKFLDTYLGESCLTEDTATPRVGDALAHLDCVVADQLEVSDHTLLVGDVERVTVAGDDREPLLYFDRSYRRVGGNL
ncbi:MAG: flavin reductase [Actinobacteria bacterium]|nr:flavin reductase [Actinomycetota bacterium]